MAVTTGSQAAELRYKAYGATRYTWGTTPTTYRYTGQREEASIGLYYYGARWYDPALGRFIQPDTIVPQAGNPQALNRYCYVNNNPQRFVDPSGHWVETAWDIANIAWDVYEVRRDPSVLNIASLVVDVGAAILPVVPAGVGLLVRSGKAAKAGAQAVGAVTETAKLINAADKIADTAKSIDKANDALHAAGNISDVAKGGSKPPIIIGENMKRVKQYAEQVGANAYRPWKNSSFNRDLAMARNQRWIKDQMMQGREIIDIGPDFARRQSGYASDFYEMERRTINKWGYDNYSKVFERHGTSGGVPGLDF